jgi:hypothetical protein
VQPVFHVYDFWRNIASNTFYIQNGFPLKTKFHDSKNVITLTYSEMDTDSIKKAVDLIQCYYIPSERVYTTLNISGLNDIMTGYNSPTYMSFYNDTDYSIEYDPSNISITNIIEKPLPVACMLSKPIRLFINSKGAMEERILYSWDYICIKRNFSKKNISYNLIQTAEYNQRIKNPEILGSIFKKEESLCLGIVPMVEFKTFTFYLRNVKLPPLPLKFTLVRIFKENTGILSDFLYGITHPKLLDEKNKEHSLFTVFGIPDMGALNTLILSQNYYVYVLKNNEHLYGIYIFKDGKINYEDIEHGNLLECVLCVSNTNMDGLFFSGFLSSLRNILKLEKKYKMILFNNLGHNDKILEKWRWKYTPVFENKAAYYIYNMVIPGMPFLPSKIAII